MQCRYYEETETGWGLRLCNVIIEKLATRLKVLRAMQDFEFEP